MSADIKIQMAKAENAKELLGIYAPYVTDTAVTFEYDVPTVSEFSERIANTLEKYPYLAAVCDGEIVGYAYASAFKERAAYARCCEVSIYVRSDFHKKGVGRALYGVLEKLLKKQGVLNVNACIAYTDTEDEFLTHTSVKFHSALGFSRVGTFKKCGYKFGRWYDMVWFEKHIGVHTENPVPFIPIGRILPSSVNECIITGA